MIKGQVQAAVDVCLDEMLPIAVLPDFETGLGSPQLGRGAVLVGCADE